MTDKTSIKQPNKIAYSEIHDMPTLLKWISQSQRHVDWETEKELCELVTVAMRKISKGGHHENHLSVLR